MTADGGAADGAAHHDGPGRHDSSAGSPVRPPGPSVGPSAGPAAPGPAVPGPGEVTATAIVKAPAARVYEAFVSWERQGEWIPFTTVRVVEGDGGEGSVIEAVTTVGPASLVDIMRVEKLDPPYQVKVVHTGKVLRGPGVMRVTPMGPDRTQVVWHEWFQLPGGSLGKAAWPLLWPGSKAGLKQTLKRFARLVESGKLP